MSGRPPKIVIPGLNRGAGIPAGYVMGRLPGTGQGPAQLLDLHALNQVGVERKDHSNQKNSTTLSTATSSVASLSASLSTVDSAQTTSLSQISSSLSGAISSTGSLSSAVSTVVSGSISAVNSRVDSLSAATGGGTGTSTSLSQISSSLSGAISSTTSLSTAVSTVDSNQSTSISSNLSKITSLSTAASAAYVQKAGDTMTGQLVFATLAAPLQVSNLGICEINLQGQGRTRYITERYSNDAFSNSNLCRKSRGTIASPLVVATNDAVGICEANMYNGSAFSASALIQAFVRAATPSNTDMESEISVECVPAGSTTGLNIASFRHSNGFSMFGSGNVVIDQNRHYRLRQYTVGTLPAAGTAGRLAAVTDALAPAYNTAVVGGGAINAPVYDNGTDWVVPGPSGGGGGGHKYEGFDVLPTAGSFTGYNMQAGATFVNDGLALVLTLPGGVLCFQAQQVAVPGSTPYDVYARVEGFWNVNTRGGLSVSNSSSHKFCSIQWLNASPNEIAILHDTGPSTFNAEPLIVTGNAGTKWFRINNDGTNLNYYLSANGITWKQIYTETLASFIGSVTHYGPMAQSGPNAADPSVWYYGSIGTTQPA